jgi:hypothetical protein
MQSYSAHANHILPDGPFNQGSKPRNYINFKNIKRSKPFMIILLEVTPKHFYREDQDLHLINTWSFINELQMN